MNASLVQALLAFLLIVIAIPVALVMLRRFRMFHSAGKPIIRLAGGIALGPRERIAIVEVGGRWLVVGVTGQSIYLLTTLDSAPEPLASSPSMPVETAAVAAAAADAAAVPTGNGRFASMLAAARRREAG